jgi:HK97 family phage major capsid protein
MTSRELRAQRAKLIEDARALISGDAPTAEDNAKFDAMMLEADNLKAQFDRIERADTEFAAGQEALRSERRPTASGDPDQDRETLDLEASTFRTWMRSGPGALSAEQQPIFAKRFQAAQSTGLDTGGGYTVPQGFYDQLMSAEKAYGGMTDVAFVFDTTTGNALPIPTDNDTTNAGAILSENVQTGAQDVTFGSVTLNAYTYTSKLVLVSNQLLQDSAFNLDAFLSDKLGTRLARITNTHFTTGTGASQPTGAVAASTLGYTAGGTSTSGSTATISSDDLVELEHSVDPAYRRAARFMMADTTLKVLKKLKDGMGRPLWMAGLQVKEPDTINGYGYTVNQDMAVPAASAKTMLFGDFSKYFIRRVAGVQVLRLTERYADYNQTGFLAFQRWDGNLVDAGTHPIKHLIQSAS